VPCTFDCSKIFWGACPQADHKWNLHKHYQLLAHAPSLLKPIAMALVHVLHMQRCNRSIQSSWAISNIVAISNNIIAQPNSNQSNELPIIYQLCRFSFEWYCKCFLLLPCIYSACTDLWIQVSLYCAIDFSEWWYLGPKIMWCFQLYLTTCMQHEIDKILDGEYTM